MQRDDDEWLAVRCQLGERDAFDALIKRWHTPLAAYVQRMAVSDHAADDIVQDAWLRIVRGFPRLRDPTRLRAWMFGIARRAVMDALREKYSAPPTVVVEDVAEMAQPHGEDVEDDLRAMADALVELPLVEREALTLFYLKELTIGEMADVLGVPIGTVKSRLFRARNQLRDRMKGTAHDQRG